MPHDLDHALEQDRRDGILAMTAALAFVFIGPLVVALLGVAV